MYNTRHTAQFKCLIVNATHTLRVHFLCNLKSIRVGQVGVCWCNSKNKAVLTDNEFHQHVAYLDLNVVRLITDRDLGHAGKVNQCQVQHCNNDIRPISDHYFQFQFLFTCLTCSGFSELHHTKTFECCHSGIFKTTRQTKKI